MTALRAVSVAAILLLPLGTASAQTPTATVIDLETLGNRYSEAYEVNNRGQVVGRSGGQAFVWTLRGGMRALEGLDPWGSSADFINDRGQVAGSNWQRGFFWSEETGVVDLGTLGGDVTYPQDMNSLGQVVGESAFTPGSYVMHGFFWSLQTGMMDLGTLPGGRFSGAYRINEDGQVLGWSETRNGKTLPVMWTREAGMKRFMPETRTQPLIAGLNNRGDVAGVVNSHAFLWSAENGLVDIGTLGGANSWANALNDAGQVGGISTTADPNQTHAFVWTPGEGIADLGNLGGRSIAVYDISGSGEIVGYALLSATYPSMTVVAYVAASSFGIQSLEPIAGRRSVANAINDRGQVAGVSTVADNGDEHAVLWLMRTPVEQIDMIVVDVQRLATNGDLPPMLAQGLIATLSAARAQAAAGRLTTACERVRVFVRQVGLIVESGALTSVSAGLLLEQTDWLQLMLRCSY